MEKLFTREEYASKAIQANEEGKFLYVYTHEQEYDVEVLEWNYEDKEEFVPLYNEDGTPKTHKEVVEVPIYDEEGNIIGYEDPQEIDVQDTETVIVKVRTTPIMVEETIIDPETGEEKTIEVQKHHTETRVKEVAELLIDEVNYYICYNENYTNCEVNPDYGEEKEQAEKERIARLSMTKLDFVKYLQTFGVTYAQVKQLIATSEEVQMQWDLCERVYRFNPLLDQLCGQLGVTAEQLDAMFILANEGKVGEE